MVTMITNNELFAFVKCEIKTKIINTLEQALASAYEKIRELRDDVSELEKYTTAFKDLKTFHQHFRDLKDQQRECDFERIYMKERFFTSLRGTGVTECCITDLKLYFRVLSTQLSDSISLDIIDVRINEGGIAFRSKLCAGEHYYEDMSQVEKMFSRNKNRQPIRRPRHNFINKSSEVSDSETW